jgi:hypothetical protein
MELDRASRILNAEWCRELVHGTAYYCVWYYEPGVNIPEIQTLVYLGMGNNEDGAQAYFFQRADSFCAVGDWSRLDAADRALVSAQSIAVFDAASVGCVADINGLAALVDRLAKRVKMGVGWDRILPDEGGAKPARPGDAGV